MNNQPEWLEERTIKLPSGIDILWSYDTEGDILEITFEPGAASATVELTDGVLLRFAREKLKPLSLGIVSAGMLLHQQEYGLPLLELDGIEHLPQEERESVLQMLFAPPLSDILKVYSFQPETRVHTIPVASLAPLAQAA